jgi:hypothetical protein
MRREYWKKAKSPGFEFAYHAQKEAIVRVVSDPNGIWLILQLPLIQNISNVTLYQ